MHELFGGKTEVPKKEPEVSMIMDFSNLAHASYHGSVRTDRKLDNDHHKYAMWRYIALNMILKTKRLYGPDEITLATEGGSWRKGFFPYYKARRKLKRQESKDIDIEEFFEVVNEFLADIKTNLPYRVIQKKGAEADDIIGILVHHLAPIRKKVIIVSRDKDFVQLKKFKNVVVYDPISGKERKVDDPVEFLTHHILKGDSGDDIPNMLSDDNVFMDDNKRQKKITQKVISEVTALGLEEYAIVNGLGENYERNRKLVELSQEIIPEEIWEGVIYEYAQQNPVANYMGVLQYLRKHKIRSLIDQVDQFLL